MPINFANGANLTLKYKVKDLLEKIKGNKKTHVENYTKAMEAYREKIIEILKKNLSKAKKKEDADHNIKLHKPINYIKYYEEAIEMLEMCDDEVITLDRTNFNQLVRDEWDWSDDFAVRSLSYCS